MQRGAQLLEHVQGYFEYCEDGECGGDGEQDGERRVAVPHVRRERGAVADADGFDHGAGAVGQRLPEAVVEPPGAAVRRDDAGFRLEPANRKYKTIAFPEGGELRIFGVVTACIHQFAAPKAKK